MEARFIIIIIILGLLKESEIDDILQALNIDKCLRKVHKKYNC